MSKAKGKRRSSSHDLPLAALASSATTDNHHQHLTGLPSSSRPNSPGASAPIGAPSGGTGPLSPAGSTSPKLQQQQLQLQQIQLQQMQQRGGAPVSPPPPPFGHQAQGYFLRNTADDDPDSLTYPQDLNFDSSMAGRPLTVQGRSTSNQNSQVFYAAMGYSPSLRPVVSRVDDYTETPAFGDLPSLLFVGKLPPSLVCPIHKGILVDPLLVTVCGHTYCSKCIEVCTSSTFRDEKNKIK